MKIIKLFVKAVFSSKLLRFIIEYHSIIKSWKNERYYHGDAVLCPCCGKTFSGFMDFKFAEGNNTERFIENYKSKICPYCFSSPRHRIVCHYFDENKKTLPTQNVLMFGAEYSIKNGLTGMGIIRLPLICLTEVRM